MDRSQLKENAKNTFKKDYGASILVTFLAGAIVSVANGAVTMISNGGSLVTFLASPGSFDDSAKVLFTIFTGSAFSIVLSFVVSALLVSVFEIGTARFFLKLRNDVPTSIGEIAKNFSDGNYKNIVIVKLVSKIIIYLFSLLFLIPGIVKTYEYAVLDYILAVRPDIDRKSALDMSKKLMYGNKFDLFLLRLSFIGWHLLSCFTCGILELVYIQPYIAAAEAEFYEDVRQKGIYNGIITEADLPEYRQIPNLNGFNGINGNGGYSVNNNGYNGFNGDYSANNNGYNGFNGNYSNNGFNNANDLGTPTYTADNGVSGQYNTFVNGNSAEPQKQYPVQQPDNAQNAGSFTPSPAVEDIPAPQNEADAAETTPSDDNTDI